MKEALDVRDGERNWESGGAGRSDGRGFGGGWMSWRWAGVLFVVYALTVAVIAGARAEPDPEEGTSDFRDFWRTAGHLARTGEIRSDLGVHNYPPFFVVFMVPWSLLPLRLAAGLFALMSVVVFGGAALLSELMLCGKMPERPRWSMLAAALAMSPYATSCAVLGNLGLMLGGMIVGLWYLVERGMEGGREGRNEGRESRGNEWGAGIVLGMAALIKVIPGLLVLFFLLKRRWRVVCGAAMVGGVLGLGLPAATMGPWRTLEEVRGFLERAAGEHSAWRTIHDETARKAKYSNQSMPIVLRRLLSRTNGDAGPGGGEMYVNVTEAGAGVIWWTYVGIIGGVLAVTGHVTFWRGREWSEAGAVWKWREQFGIWCCVVILASPLVWTHYYPVLLWPVMMAADGAMRGVRMMRLVMAGWMLGAVMTAWPEARAAGVHLWMTMGTWGAMCWRVWAKQGQ